MLVEVANALCLTYIATEYTIASQDAARRFADDDSRKNARIRRGVGVIGIVIVLNVLDHYTISMPGIIFSTTAAGKQTHRIVYALLHVPRVLVAAIAYFVALYWDCKRTVGGRIKFVKDFLPRVTKAFLIVLPLYPLAAILISFGFLILITIFETFHIPESYLNWPIYYGTLYGPFSYIYHVVKLSVVKESQMSLPNSFREGGVRLGGLNTTS